MGVSSIKGGEPVCRVVDRSHACTTAGISTLDGCQESEKAKTTSLTSDGEVLHYHDEDNVNDCSRVRCRL